VKHVVQESINKLKIHIIIETTEGILQQEVQVKEKVTTTRDTLHKFIVTWKKA
jgi:hypothetical protein